MYYHASKTKDIKVLNPHVSSHGKALVYFSTKKENVLVYLSNPVEKYIQEKYNRPMNHYVKWASYGITKEGLIRLEEYYPNALAETFKGINGYIYTTSVLQNAQPLNGIKDVFVCQDKVEVESSEYIEDAYQEILKAEQEGKIVIQRYETISDKKKEWIQNVILNEFKNTDNEDYKEFLLEKFDWLKEKIEVKEKNLEEQSL